MDKRIYLCLAHMSGKEQGFIKLWLYLLELLQSIWH